MTIPYGPWKKLGIALLLAIAACSQWVKGEWGDKFWLLETANLFVSGKHFYNEIFQPNLPMIFWIYAVPVWLARHVGIENQHMLVLVTIGMLGLSVLLCHRLMRYHTHFAAHPDMQARHSVLLVFILLFFVNVSFFGDREHLIMVVMLPFFLRHMPSLAKQELSPRLRLLIACLAGLGPCIKPHAALLLGGVYLIRIIRERSFRVLFTMEVYASAAVIVAYLLLMCLTTTGYFTLVFPMLLVTYSANNNGIGTLMFYVTSAFSLAVTLADFRLRYDSPMRRDILYFLGLCVLGLGYVLINNGWVYTFYPINSIILLLTGWVYWEFKWLRQEYARQGKDAKPFYFGATACYINVTVSLLYILIAHCGFVYYTVTAGAEDIDPGDKNIVEITRILKENHIKRIGTISISFTTWGLQTRATGAEMVTRFNHVFMLPIFFHRDEAFAKQNEWVLRYTADAYAEDLNRNKPEMMLVDYNDDFGSTGKKVDLVEYLSRYPSFAQAWKSYYVFTTLDICKDEGIKERKGLDGGCRTRLYRRKETK